MYNIDTGYWCSAMKESSVCLVCRTCTTKAVFTIFCLHCVVAGSAYKLIWTRVAMQRNEGIEFFSILALQHVTSVIM